MNDRPPLPPFTAETAAQKARSAEDAWNSCDPKRVSLACTPDSRCRNGNENWEFDDHGLMRQRHASINDTAIDDVDRLFHWDRSAPRPGDHPGLTELGL